MILYILAAFIIGFSSINYQIMFIREFLIVFYGNELCIGSILGLWLAGIACGAGFGSKISSKLRHPGRLFQISFFLLHFLFPVSLMLIRFFIHTAISGKGELIPFYKTILIAAILMVPVTFQIGLTFPLACQCTAKNKNTGISSGKIYFSESAGSLTGGILFTFFLIQHFDYFQISFALFMVSALILTLFMFNKLKYIFFSSTIISILGIHLFYCGLPSRIHAFSINQRWNAFFSPLALEESTDTKYQNISISCQNQQLDIFNNLKYAYSLPADPFSSEIFINFVMCQSTNPKKILMIGGIFQGFLEPILRYNPDKIDLIEIDKKYYDTVKNYIPDKISAELNSNKIHIHFTDGRFFVKNTTERYDIILINMPDPETAMINRFYTFNFFRQTAKILSDTGIIVFSLSSAENYYGEEVLRYNASIYKTLKTIFKNVIVTYGEKKIFAASSSDNIISANPQILINRFNRRQIKTDSFSPMIFMSLLDEKRLAFVKDNFERILPEVKLNTDSNPIAYHYNLYLWDKFSGSKLSVFLKLVENLNPVQIISALAILIFLFIIPQYTSSKMRNTKFFRIILFWAILSTGFSAIGMEILLLFCFQNIFGYLYHMIGFIVALFMSGLMAGSFAAIKSIKKFPDLPSLLKILIYIELAIPLLAFCIPFIIIYFNVIESQILIKFIFFAIVILCGFLTGIEFPISVTMFSAGEDITGLSAGIIDAADHTGAFLGALFAGTFLLPLLGITATAIIVGLLNLSSFILIVSSRFTLNILKKQS